MPIDQDKLDRIFDTISKGKTVEGWAARERGDGTGQILEGPDDAYERKSPNDPWVKIPPQKGNV